MSSQRGSSADALPTRRQLREAARHGEVSTVNEAHSVEHVATLAADARSLTRRELRMREQAKRESASTISTEARALVIAALPLPQRATDDQANYRKVLREQAAALVATLKQTKSLHQRWLPRVAVLGALGALTTVVPLTGAAVPSQSAESSTGPPVATSSAFEVLVQGGTPVSQEAAAALVADPLASLRSMSAASRSGNRDETTCSDGESAANGVSAASSAGGVEVPELVEPLAEGSYRLTSRYGNRVHPLFGSYSQHTGLDMAASAGTPIHATADGTVTYVGEGRDGRSSMLVVLKHEVTGEKFWTWYVHMYPNGVYVQEGQEVKAGEVIGGVGSYGNSTGPHLHFEVHIDEQLTTIDPEAWMVENNVAPLTSETLECVQSADST